MTEYKFANATVRIHGTPDREKLEAAALQFLRDIEKKKQKEAKPE